MYIYTCIFSILVHICVYAYMYMYRIFNQAKIHVAEKASWCTTSHSSFCFRGFLCKLSICSQFWILSMKVFRQLVFQSFAYASSYYTCNSCILLVCSEASRWSPTGLSYLMEDVLAYENVYKLKSTGREAPRAKPFIKKCQSKRRSSMDFHVFFCISPFVNMSMFVQPCDNTNLHNSLSVMTKLHLAFCFKILYWIQKNVLFFCILII